MAKVSDEVNNIVASYTVTKIDDALIGEIDLWPSATIPNGYLLCDGRAVSRTTYADLFNIIGTTYGAGDGSTTFNLPNISGKTVVGSNGTYKLGNSGGSKTSKITTLPSHNHSIPSLSGTAAKAGAHTHNVDPLSNTAYTLTLAKNSNSVTNLWHSYTEYQGFLYEKNEGWFYDWGKGDTNVLASGGSHTHSVTTQANTTGSTGNGTSFSVQNPYIAENYIIKY